MRYVPSISPVTTSPNTRQVRGLTAAQAIKPVYPREQPRPYVEQPAHHQERTLSVEQPHHGMPAEDRRKACRRTQHLPVLVELRSGLDRRRHNLRGDDPAEHIDETA